MEALVIKGRSSDGKSTTMRELCKALNPQKVMQVNLKEKILTKSVASDIQNGTFIITVSGKDILISAGSPTEQGVKITRILEICKTLGYKIDFALVSMRTRERKQGFSTISELKKIASNVTVEPIKKISGSDFLHSSEWSKRISDMKAIVLNGIK